jgi:mRNA interferase HicA
MDGAEFIKRIRKLGRRKGLSVVFDTRPGKGSHGRLWLGDHFTTIKDRRKEISKGLLAEMLKQLGIDPREF